ncbi:Tc5 transposase DNA-binding domain-containing protein [Hirsutella rhossiliensis]
MNVTNSPPTAPYNYTMFASQQPSVLRKERLLRIVRAYQQAQFETIRKDAIAHFTTSFHPQNMIDCARRHRKRCLLMLPTVAYTRRTTNLSFQSEAQHSRRYDHQRAKCEDPQKIQQWYDRLAATKQKWGILDEDVYNLEETRAQMSLPDGLYQPRLSSKASYAKQVGMKQDVNERSWTSDDFAIYWLKKYLVQINAAAWFVHIRIIFSTGMAVTSRRLWQYSIYRQTSQTLAVKQSRRQISEEILASQAMERKGQEKRAEPREKTRSGKSRSFNQLPVRFVVVWGLYGVDYVNPPPTRSEKFPTAATATGDQLVPRKERVLLAVRAYQQGQFESTRKAAAADVPQSTVSDRLRGVIRRRDAQVNNLKLTATEETALVQWILSMDERGMPPTVAYTRRMANLLLSERGEDPVRENWVRKFVGRHGEIKAKYSRRYDYQRAKCEDPQKIQGCALSV